MKSFLISVAILLTVSVFVTVGSILVRNSTDDLLQKISALPDDLPDQPAEFREAAEAVTELDVIWHSRSPYLSAVVSYPWVASVDTEMIRLRESLVSGSRNDYRTARTALYEAVSYIRKREGFSLSNFI